MTGKFTGIWMATIALAFLLSACGPAKPAALSQEAVEQVSANILQAIDQGDYADFRRDFSEVMKKAIPESQFQNLRGMIASASGKSQSCANPEISNRGDFAIYAFPCQFEKETVVMTLTFRIGGSQVEGLFFNSVNLRKQGK